MIMGFAASPTAAAGSQCHCTASTPSVTAPGTRRSRGDPRLGVCCGASDGALAVGGTRPMQLPVRYHVMESIGPDDNSEANIVHTAATVELDVAEVAIVLVDTWAGHPMPSHLASHGRDLPHAHSPPAGRGAGRRCHGDLRPVAAGGARLRGLAARQPGDRAAGAELRRLATPGVPRDYGSLRRRCASAPGNSRRTMTGRFPTGSPFTASTRQSRRRRKTSSWQPARSCTRRARRGAWCT